MKTKKKRGFNIQSVVISIVLLIGAVLCLMAVRTQMLPTRYIVLLCAVLLALAVVIGLLIRDRKKPRAFWPGIALAALYVAAAAAGSVTIARTQNALRAVTAPGNGASVGVFVSADDPARTLDATVDYTFGVLTRTDREEVDKTVSKLSADLGAELAVTEYRTASKLVDALLKGEVGAVITGRANLERLSAKGEYRALMSQVRELTELHAPTPTPAPTPEPTPSPTPEPTPEPEPESDFPWAFTVFVSGIDSREGLVDRSYSDVNILFTVNRKTHEILVLTTPRDSFVPLSISDGARDKLTHAGQFGIDVQVDTMEMLYDIDIDYWFRLSFGGFRDIIEAMGGVTVYSDYSFTAFDGTWFSEGKNDLDGAKALSFARERKSFSDGDLQRGRDQMKLIEAMIQKVVTLDFLTNYDQILDAVANGFETTVPYDLLAEMVRYQLDDGGDWNVTCYLVSGPYDYQVTYSEPGLGERYVRWIDDEHMETARSLMKQVRDGETPRLPEK